MPACPRTRYQARDHRYRTNINTSRRQSAKDAGWAEFSVSDAFAIVHLSVFGRFQGHTFSDMRHIPATRANPHIVTFGEGHVPCMCHVPCDDACT